MIVLLYGYGWDCIFDDLVGQILIISLYSLSLLCSFAKSMFGDSCIFP